MGYGDGVKGFQVLSPFERKVILSRDVIFDELSMLHSKCNEDLVKTEDVIKQVEFQSSTIKNISDQKQFEALHEIDQDLQMNPRHQNSEPIKGTDQMSQNHSKHPKTTTPRKSQRQVKALEKYDFDIVSYALQIVEKIDLFKPITYLEAITYYEAEKWTITMNEEMKFLQKNQT